MSHSLSSQREEDYQTYMNSLHEEFKWELCDHPVKLIHVLDGDIFEMSIEDLNYISNDKFGCPYNILDEIFDYDDELVESAKNIIWWECVYLGM